jgi:O-antigen/teichoic acid export membrane protein
MQIRLVLILYICYLQVHKVTWGQIYAPALRYCYYYYYHRRRRGRGRRRYILKPFFIS